MSLCLQRQRRSNVFTVHVTWTAAETQDETGRGGQRRLHNMITGNAPLSYPRLITFSICLALCNFLSAF